MTLAEPSGASVMRALRPQRPPLKHRRKDPMASRNEGPLGGHPRSTAKIADHPIHPMLIPFPIVCFILTFVVDILYARGNTSLATASNWLLIVGLVMAGLAAVTGLTDFLGEKRIQVSDAVKHMLANVTAV